MDRLLALQASAGSGKTFALTVRYLSLLFLGANPSNIVALTFTKKAANEMKERIFKTLVNLENEVELDEICKATSKSKSEILTLKSEVSKRFLNSNLHVETIDAFFGKILRKFALNLGIMPDFQTTDETHQGKLQELFIKEAYKDKKTFNSLVNFMLSEQKKLSNIFDFFTALYEKSKELDFSKQNLFATTAQKIDFSAGSEVSTLPKMSKSMDLFGEVETSLPKEKQSFYATSEEKILLKSHEIKDFLQTKNASKTAVGMFSVDSLDELISKSFWSRDSLDYRTFAKVYEASLDKMYHELKSLYKSYCLQKEAYVLGEIFGLFRLYERTNFELSSQMNELTFSDVTFLVYKLLNEEISNEFLYFRLDGAIEHLLIDEFQDTNVVQFDILKPIVEEIYSGEGVKKDRTFFYVGDTKQSIYRFRGGSRELFDVVAKKFHIKVDTLDTNYRSDGHLVDFVNEVFKPIFPNYTSQKVTEDKKNRGFVQVSTCEDLFEGLKTSLQTLFDNGVSEDDIAILCHTNADTLSVKEFILDWDESLHVSIESTKKLINSRLVKALCEFLKFSYFGFRINEKNTLVLLGKSFDDELHVKIENFDKPLEVLLVQAVNILELDGTDEDVLYFIEIAKDYENIQTLLFELDRFNQSAKSSDNLGIKALTIHKSKGLEFKHVIVLDKLTRPNNQSGTFIYEYEKERLKKLFVRMKNREYVDDEYKNAKEKDASLNQIDIKNAMYVAFTRAKNSIFVLKKEKSSSMEFLDLKDFQKGAITPSKTKKEKKSSHVFEKMSFYGSQKSEHKVDENEYDVKAIYFGLALHYLLELSFDFTELSIKKAYEATKNRYGEHIDTKDVLKRALNLINDKKFLSLIDGGVLKKEQPLIFNGERKQLDLLVEFDDKYIIIDYKTSSSVHDEHIKQVSSYKKALKSFAKKEVYAYLFYIKNDSVECVNV